ncbi:hypothetical protein So717_31230 [Roseobacter cerasinus]|uniref:Lipoprotein n=1 Tax=Roseobacter cerasinus TaxID=2602289 RepID=A0A640VVD1_9RHOB|nr:hypothetical protein [Roseobacter cerasinus]GFE51370.1 hypothetical protein So717_31230 [Roseobacter cerasinus]
MRKIALIAAAALVSACANQGPGNNAGDWEVSTLCLSETPGEEVLFRGIAELDEVQPNVFVGRYFNNFRHAGNVKANLDGDRLSAEINWSNGNTTTVLLQRQPGTNTYVGSDNTNCRVRAERPGA